MPEPIQSASRMHEGQPVLTGGQPLASARAAMIMLHGRGASALDVLQLGSHLDVTGFILLAPQAAGYTWYPNRFNTPVSSNQPWLDSALGVIEALIGQLGQAGVPPERVILFGFSQGACLALEFAARRGAPLGGVAGLSGGLIGSDSELTGYPGSLDGMPVFLGCSDSDPHIPQQRVHASAEIFQRLGAQVEKRLYPGLGHTVNDDELQQVQAMMKRVLEIGTSYDRY